MCIMNDIGEFSKNFSNCLFRHSLVLVEVCKNLDIFFETPLSWLNSSHVYPLTRNLIVRVFFCLTDLKKSPVHLSTIFCHLTLDLTTAPLTFLISDSSSKFLYLLIFSCKSVL